MEQGCIGSKWPSLLVGMIGVVMTLLALPSRADGWSGEDKNLHFVGSATLAKLVASGTGQASLGFWSSVAVGAAKEYSDRYRPGHEASLKDLVWDITGAYFGTAQKGWMVYNKGTTTVVSFSMQF